MTTTNDTRICLFSCNLQCSLVCKNQSGRRAVSHCGASVSEFVQWRGEFCQFRFELRAAENQPNAGIHSPHCAIVTSVQPNLTLQLSQSAALCAKQSSQTCDCVNEQNESVGPNFEPRNQIKDEVATTNNNMLAGCFHDKRVG